MAPSTNTSSAAHAQKTSAIYAVDSIWSKTIQKVKGNDKKNDGTKGKPDAYVFIVGSQGCGKTTVLNAFLHPDKIGGITKPTEGLDFTFARKSSSLMNVDRKDVANIWEVAGVSDFTNDIASSDSIFLTPKQVATATVVIVLDLSKPWTVLDTLAGWLDRVNARLEEVYEKFNRRGSKIPSQLKARSKRAYGSSHEDHDQVKHTGITLLIVANKYDQFCNEDAELRKIMARTLRYIAHTNGASLIYTCSKGDNKDCRITLTNFRNVLNHYSFIGADRKLPSKSAIQADHLQAVFMPAGSDSLRDIGRPKGREQGNKASSSTFEEWRSIFERFFQTKEEQQNNVHSKSENSEFAEPEIDALLEQKMRELEEYHRQCRLEVLNRRKASSDRRASIPATQRAGA